MSSKQGELRGAAGSDANQNQNRPVNELCVSCSPEPNAESSGEGSGQTAGDQEGWWTTRTTFDPVLPASVTSLFFAPGVSEADEPDPVLPGGEQNPGRPGGPADRRTAPAEDQGGLRPAAAPTPGCEE